jgi:hypothetical protein
LHLFLCFDSSFPHFVSLSLYSLFPCSPLCDFVSTIIFFYGPFKIP